MQIARIADDLASEKPNGFSVVLFKRHSSSDYALRSFLHFYLDILGSISLNEIGLGFPKRLFGWSRISAIHFPFWNEMLGSPVLRFKLCDSVTNSFRAHHYLFHDVIVLFIALFSMTMVQFPVGSNFEMVATFFNFFQYSLNLLLHSGGVEPNASLFFSFFKYPYFLLRIQNVCDAFSSCLLRQFCKVLSFAVN